MENPQKITILLTATVDPDTSKYGENYPSAKTREPEYINAAEYYASFPFVEKVLLVENSNWNFKHEFSDKIRVVSIPPTLFSNTKIDVKFNRKTLGEYECITTGLNIIDRDDFVIKLTGRLKIHNFDRFIYELDNNKINVAQYIENVGWVSSWFIAGKVSLLRDLFDDMYKPLYDVKFEKLLVLFTNWNKLDLICIEKILFKSLNKDDLNIIKGNYVVEGKPCTRCEYHYPNYTFDGYIKNFPTKTNNTPKHPKPIIHKLPITHNPVVPIFVNI